VQVANSFGKKNDPHNCGALYSRIMRRKTSRKRRRMADLRPHPVDRHLTVIHNGKKTIDNQPVLGCTGGALWWMSLARANFISRAITPAWTIGSGVAAVVK
jgi:hypothetical protein